MSPHWGGGGGGMRMGRTDKKQPEIDGPLWPIFKRLLSLLLPYKKPLIFCAILLLLTTPLTLVTPWLWGFVVDEVLIGKKAHLLLYVLAFYSFAHFAGTGLGAWRTNIMGKTGARLVFDLRNRVYKKLQGQSHSYFNHQKSGDLMVRMVSDVAGIQQIAVTGIDTLVRDVLLFTGVCGALILIQWKIGLLAMIPLVGIWFGNKIFSKKIRSVYRDIQDFRGDLGGKLSENIQGMSVIKSFGREEAEVENFTGLTEKLRNSTVQSVNIRTIFMPAMSTVAFVSNMIMLGGGSYLVLKGEFTVGGLMMYSRYWLMFVGPIGTVSQWHNTLQQAAAAANRVFQILDEPDEIKDLPDSKPISDVRGNIEFKDVSFSYKDSEDVLHSVSFKVEAGQRVALVGESGAGKSTILALVSRFYDPIEGKVFLDGQDIKHLTIKSFRDNMAVVQQESFHFDATVLENLRYGRPDASKDEVITASKAANAHEFIEGLPDGYNTMVGERGVRLSGGQKQRLSVARAFLANPRILILDEPTSSVEPESEHIILQALEKLMKGRTTFLTSHRISLVRDADKIIVIEGGKVTDEGSHEDLMKSSAMYRNMVRLHSGGEALIDEPPVGGK